MALYNPEPSNQIFSSTADFILDEGEAFAAVMEMVNVTKFRSGLTNAEPIVNEGNNADKLVALLQLEGIDNFSHSKIVDPSGITVCIGLIEIIASNFIHAIADLKNCDVQSALAFLADDYDPDIDWTVGDYAKFFVGAAALIVTIGTPIVGDETLAAIFLSSLGLLGAGVGVTQSVIDYVGDDDANKLSFIVSVLLSGLPAIPGLGTLGTQLQGFRAADGTVKTAMSLTLIEHLARLSDAKGVSILALIDYPDTVSDIAAALEITFDEAQIRVDNAKEALKKYEELVNSLGVKVDSSGPGAIELPQNIPKFDSSDTNRLRLWLIHNGVNWQEAAKMLEEHDLVDWSAFWEKYPGLNEALPPDLADVISKL